MKLIAFIVLFIFECATSSWAQLVSCDYRITFYNTAVFSQALLDVFGEDSVKCWLDSQDKTLMLHAEVDTTGTPIQIRKIRHLYEVRFTMNDWDKITTAIKHRNLHLYVWLVYDGSMPEDELIDCYKSDFRRNPRSIYVNAAFPGELMRGHPYSDKNKIDYLKERIAYWLSHTSLAMPIQGQNAIEEDDTDTLIVTNPDEWPYYKEPGDYYSKYITNILLKKNSRVPALSCPHSLSVCY